MKSFVFSMNSCSSGQAFDQITPAGQDDVIVLAPGPDGNVTESVTGITGLTGFIDPLDLVEDPRTGNLYIAEFGGQKLTLLRPHEAASSKVFRERVVR